MRYGNARQCGNSFGHVGTLVREMGREEVHMKMVAADSVVWVIFYNLTGKTKADVCGSKKIYISHPIRKNNGKTPAEYILYYCVPTALEKMKKPLDTWSAKPWY
jgi:hypothetical protein